MRHRGSIEGSLPSDAPIQEGVPLAPGLGLLRWECSCGAHGPWTSFLHRPMLDVVGELEAGHREHVGRVVQVRWGRVS